MIRSSRPIRFLVIVLCGWTGMRVVNLWPTVDPNAVELQATLDPPPAIAPTPRRPPTKWEVRNVAPVIAQWRGVARRLVRTPSARRLHSGSVSKALEASPAVVPSPRPVIAETPAPMPAAFYPAGVDRPPAFAVSRLSASAWAIARPGGRATPFANQLGGSQAGVRVGYAVDAARRLAVTARMATALGAREHDLSLGLDWRPTRLPVHLIAERRFALGRGRGGWVAGAIGGVGPVEVAPAISVEAYGQGGVIVRDRAEGFVDAAARVTTPVATISSITFDLGAGAWGAAQRGASRVDIGPTLGARIPVGPRAVRLSLDWRQRVAGNARPGSGPAISAGIDF